MSPTATIIAVIVALVFFAWMFQTDNRDDPAYQAYLRKLQEERQKQPVVGSGVASTDPGVEKANGLSGGKNNKTEPGGNNAVKAAFNNEPGTGDASTDPPINPVNSKVKKPNQNEDGFTLGAKLDGTYILVSYIGDPATDAADAASITFRLDGSFITRNMSQAEIGMEGAGVAAAIDRGTGRYTLFKRTLDMTYTDGLVRKSGNQRSFTIVPVMGEGESPKVITIQGKIFKLAGAN